jgi:hypothetical protein
LVIHLKGPKDYWYIHIYHAGTGALLLAPSGRPHRLSHR